MQSSRASEQTPRPDSTGSDEAQPGAQDGELSPDELRARLDEARAQAATAEDRYLRARADLENYRRRTERDLATRVMERRDDLLRAWLDVVDSVERAIALEDEHSEAARGLRAVLAQMEAILSRYGVTRTGAEGERFDPELHEAIAAVPADGRPAGTITDVARTGYSVDDRVLRPAQVAVARAD
ncbi:MAG: nucleotide exchange factor GrpE [Gaiellaceae bacterium]